jgi:hypothetical protein
VGGGPAEPNPCPRLLLDAGTFEDLPGKWQAAILEAEQNRPQLRLVKSDSDRA